MDQAATGRQQNEPGLRHQLLDLYRRAAGFYQLRARLEALERIQRETLDAVSGQREQIAVLHEMLVNRSADDNADDEVATCRNIADRCIFIWGPARSNTSILARIVNTSKDARLLAEANFFARTNEKHFDDWYNAMHRSFGNQDTKTSRAPHFCDGNWWEWLKEAAEVYDRVGDKMAFSPHHFGFMPTEQIRAFFEARFFSARYVFTFRDPVQTLLSTARMFKISDDATLRSYIVAWLRMAQLWADCIRTFPRTFTICDDGLTAASISELSEFLSLDLTGSERLLNNAERRSHEMPAAFTTLHAIEGDLARIYADMRISIGADPVLLFAEQKRTLAGNDSREDPSAATSVAPRAIGQVWARAEHLALQLSCGS